jgi:hypothetical protein
VWKVPWRDETGNSDRLSRHHHLLGSDRRWDNFTVDSPGFLREPFDEAVAVSDFSEGLSDWLAALSRHDLSDFLLVRLEEIEPFLEESVDSDKLPRRFSRKTHPEQDRTVFGSCVLPGLAVECLVSCIDGFLRISSVHVRNFTDNLLIRWIYDIESLVVTGVGPLSIDIRLILEQGMHHSD